MCASSEPAESFSQAMRELRENRAITREPPSEAAAALAKAVRQRLGQAPEPDRPEPDPQPAPDRRADRSQGRTGAVASREQAGRDLADALNALAHNKIQL